MKTLIKTLAATASIMALTGTAAADAPKLADTAYTVERVTFISGGQTIVGDLYVPAGVTDANPAEAVIVTGSWTSIKEHMSGLYASELAERGQIALSFDFRSWGESGGDTRSLESPEMKIDDIIAAGNFLVTRADVSGVNGLGICASAGYMATAAERSPVLQSVALVAPWLHDAEIVDVIYGGEDGVSALIETGRTAAAMEAETGEPQLIAAAGEADSGALMAMDGGYYNDPDRGRIAEWENTFNLASWEGWLTFDGVRAASEIEQPVLIVHSEDAAIPQGARKFEAALTSEGSQSIWLDGVGQFDFYDGEAQVDQAADFATAFFAEN
ncbi:MAG: alpha/beta hydrolase [Pseudomonadota bacterium]